jgi:hypothetical protein
MGGRGSGKKPEQPNKRDRKAIHEKREKGTKIWKGQRKERKILFCPSSLKGHVLSSNIIRRVMKIVGAMLAWHPEFVQACNISIQFQGTYYYYLTV